ncbi:MAG: NTP transferase domain-containing protein [Cytophagaceae bacterium]|nr:NTP transferase domain-containing protein [Cytophagaceae bacterium]
MKLLIVFLQMGPYGAILSAFKFNPNVAWLVLACDMPLVGKNEIDFLIQNRNPSKIATACYNPETNFPDPLFTIWGPKLIRYYYNFCHRDIPVQEKF